MSESREIEVSCPQCGRKLMLTVWSSVNVKLDPAEKEKILAGTFAGFKCPDCGKEANLGYSFLYHDPTQKRMVQVLAPGEQDEAARIKELEELLGEAVLSTLQKQGYELRVVRNVYELKEKLIIWDAGYDDCVMEVFKNFTLAGIPKEELAARKVEHVFFYRTEEGGPEFQLYCEGSELAGCTFFAEMYETVSRECAPIIKRHKTGGPQIIDINWGLEVMGETMQEKDMSAPEA